MRHQQKHHDEPDDHQVAEQAGLALQLVGAEGGEPADQRQQQRKTTPHEGQYHGVGEFYTLHPRGDQQSRQGGAAGGDQDGNKHRRRVRRAQLRAVQQDGHGEKGDGGGVEHQEQDLRVGSHRGGRVERL